METIRLGKYCRSAVYGDQLTWRCEMNPVQLWETTLNPDARHLLTLSTNDFTGYVRDVFNKLMAKSEVASRRAWMEEAGHLVDADE